ncbi:MAG: alpha/beta hydrolase [Burkholderiaceae bacterium]
MADPVIHQPSLYLIGDRDLVAPMYKNQPIEATRRSCPTWWVAQVIEHCGHWTQQEQPGEVNRLLKLPG